MTNIYPDDAPLQEKLYQEFRTLRCVLERVLRTMDEGLFVDYQLEKFGSLMTQKPKLEEIDKFIKALEEKTNGNV